MPGWTWTGTTASTRPGEAGDPGGIRPVLRQRRPRPGPDRGLSTPATRIVVLDAETSPFIDITAAKMLAQLAAALRRDGSSSGSPGTSANSGTSCATPCRRHSTTRCSPRSTKHSTSHPRNTTYSPTSNDLEGELIFYAAAWTLQARAWLFRFYISANASRRLIASAPSQGLPCLGIVHDNESTRFSLGRPETM